MYHSRKFHISKYIFWKRQNIFRWLELVLCSGCLSLAIILYFTRLYITTKVILLVVNTSFFFVTFVDIISWIQLKPMGYKTWILFATTAFLTLWLCGGLLVFVKAKIQPLMYACPLYFATGAVYLLDCLWVIIEYISWVKGHKVAPLRTFTDRAVSTCHLFQEVPYDSYPVRTRSKCPIVVKPRNIVTVSYGGTFPVSKDQTPLPSPDTRSISRVNIDSSAKSWRKSTVSMSSRGRPFGDAPGKDLTLHSRQNLIDQDTLITDDQEIISVIRPIRSKTYRNPIVDPFSARVSEPSTVPSQDILSEKVSKDSLQQSSESSPREQNFTQRKYRSLSSRSYPCNTRITKTFNRMSARTLKESLQKSHENSPRESLGYRSVSGKPPFTEPLNVRISKPSTAQSLERISEKTSGDSVQQSCVELSRQKHLIEQKGETQTRGAQCCDCPLMTCPDCYEQLQSHHSSMNEEVTKHTSWEESIDSTLANPTMQRQTLPLKSKPEAAPQIEQYQCTNCGKICHYKSQPLVNVSSFCCKCSSSKKNKPSGQKISHSSHVSDLEHHMMRPTKPDSELGQYYSEITGKRNGLDPEDHMKRRSRQNRNILYQNSICKDPKCSQEYNTSMDSPHLEKSAVHLAPVVSQFTQESRHRRYLQKEESTVTDIAPGYPQNVSDYGVDQEVLATKQFVDTTVQAINIHKDATVQSESQTKPLTADARVSVHTIPDTIDDMLACINYIPPIKHYKPGIIHSKEEEEEQPIVAETIIENIKKDMELYSALKQTPISTDKANEKIEPYRAPNQTVLEDDVIQRVEHEIQTVETLDLVPISSEESQEVPAVACTCNLDSENKPTVTMEDIFKLFYQPCHHPPICPLCYEQRRNMLEAQRGRGSVEMGINTDQSTESQKKRNSLFKKKKK